MREIDIENLAVALTNGATLIDVRESSEFTGGHAPGAVSIPVGQLAERVTELDRQATVYVICASGNRSGTMTEVLVNAGYDAWSVRGGTTAWAESGRPLEGGR